MIRAIISLLASGLAAVQVFLLSTKGRGVCFNDGCEIVDSLTTVSPLTFNIAGFLYFLVLFWLFFKGRNGNEYWHKLARLLLLAGLAVEAVLVFFQYRIAMVFCSYCLVIFSVILLLNLMSGLRQIIRGAVLFSAVLLACFCLRFDMAAGKGAPLTAGSVATLAGKNDGTIRYLFFSSSCSHCEKILDSLRTENRCSFRFNPVDRLTSFQFAGAESSSAYDPAINAAFLQNLSITGVPALVVVEKEDTLVLQGERPIMQYLDGHCRPEMKGRQGEAPKAVPPLTFTPDSQQDGSCPVTGECEPEQSK